MSNASGEATGVTITATPHYRGRFLIVRRSLEDASLPGYWAFPGGRVHFNSRLVTRPDGSSKRKFFAETLTQTAVREVWEETGLIGVSAFYVDSYDSLGDRAAAHFCVDVESDQVKLDKSEVSEFRWIDNVDDMKRLTPRIPGLDNHLKYILDELDGRYSGPFRPLDVLDLIPERYVN